MGNVIFLLLDLSAVALPALTGGLADSRDGRDGRQPPEGWRYDRLRHG